MYSSEIAVPPMAAFFELILVYSRIRKELSVANHATLLAIIVFVAKPQRKLPITITLETSFAI